MSTKLEPISTITPNVSTYEIINDTFIVHHPALRRLVNTMSTQGDEKNKKQGGGGGKGKPKAPPADLVIPPPRPQLSKAERRALQEQQRAAKGAPKAATSPAVTAKKAASSPTVRPVERVADPPAISLETNLPPNSRVGLVSHLSKDPRSALYDTGAVLRHLRTVQPGLHPAVIELGYRYGMGAVLGGNARARAMLDAYRIVLAETDDPQNAVDRRAALENTVLKPAFHYWTEYCRPHSVSMGNAFAFLKTAVNSMDRDLPWKDMVELLIESIDAYIRERIDFAVAAIAETACSKVLRSLPGKTEVILTYGHFAAVAAVLSRAISSTRQALHIIIVDSPPLLEGRILLRTLQRDALQAKSDVEFTYLHLHAITYVLPRVTKVLLGAAALQSDGSVTGRVGTAVVALAARARNVPVLVCAETHKISNRGVPLESLTQNELSSGWSKNIVHDVEAAATPNRPTGEPKRLDLLYDSTPASFVTGIVTEFGIIPPSSVAVLLREMNQPQPTGKIE
jgi:translation initiation factor eIF-2B subunit delta